MFKVFIPVLFSFLILSFSCSQTKTTSIAVPPNVDKRAFVLQESKAGGTLDYFTSIKGKEFVGSQIKPGLYVSQIEVALYKWGKSCKDIGVKSVEETLSIFKEHKGSELDPREISLITKGYNKEFN